MRFHPIVLIAALILIVTPCALTAADAQAVTLKDGRRLIGIYDEAAGTITLTGATKGVVHINKDDVVSTEVIKTSAAANAPIVDGDKKKRDVVAILDQQIDQAQQKKIQNENDAKDATKKAELERGYAGTSQDANRAKTHNDAATRFTQSAAKYMADAARLTTEITDLQKRRDDAAKQKLTDDAHDAAKKAAAGISALIDSAQKGLEAKLDSKGGDTPIARYQRLDVEVKDIQQKISVMSDLLKDRQEAMIKLKPQLDQAQLLNLDLSDMKWDEGGNETLIVKEKRLEIFKTYNTTMAALRAAKIEFNAGKEPALDALFTTLRADAMRQAYRDKNNKPLIFWDDDAATKAKWGG